MEVSVIFVNLIRDQPNCFIIYFLTIVSVYIVQYIAFDRIASVEMEERIAFSRRRNSLDSEFSSRAAEPKIFPRELDPRVF